MSELTVYDALVPGSLGDTPIEMRLTAREVAALQYVVSLTTDDSAQAFGELFLTAAYRGAEEYGLGDRWSVAFQSAQVRLGIAIARVLQPETTAELSALLARIDQDKAALDNTGEE